MTKNCLICNKIFIIPNRLSYERRMKVKFCSSMCKFVAQKENPNSGCFRKGHLSWNNRRKIQTNTGRTHFKEGMIAPNKGKVAFWVKGENHPQWKGGITGQTRLQRTRFSETVRKQILERDNYTCQMCNKRGGILHVDHIQSWEDYIELRFSMDNCRTLCRGCHYQITWGKPMPKNSKWGIRPRRNDCGVDAKKRIKQLQDWKLL